VFCGASISGINQVPRNIDAENLRADLCRWQCGRAIAATKIEYFHSFADSDAPDQILTAFAHSRSDAREITFFPERLVWIDGRC
jgi:hypothetical protein